MRTGELGLDGWSGRNWTKVEIVGETPKRYRIRALQDMRLAAYRFLLNGQEALVPKTAIRNINSGDSAL